MEPKRSEGLWLCNKRCICRRCYNNIKGLLKTCMCSITGSHIGCFSKSTTYTTCDHYDEDWVLVAKYGRKMNFVILSEKIKDAFIR